MRRRTRLAGTPIEHLGDAEEGFNKAKSTINRMIEEISAGNCVDALYQLQKSAENIGSSRNNQRWADDSDPVAIQAVRGMRKSVSALENRYIDSIIFFEKKCLIGSKLNGMPRMRKRRR